MCEDTSVLEADCQAQFCLPEKLSTASGKRGPHSGSPKVWACRGQKTRTCFQTLISHSAPRSHTPARLVVNMAPGRGESEDGPRLELSLLSTKSPLQLWSLKMSMSFMSLVETFYPICFSPFTFSVTQQNVWSEGDPGRA